MIERETDMSWTQASVLLLLLLCGCVPPARTGRSSGSADREPAPTRVAPEVQRTTICVVENGNLSDLVVSYDPVHGDTLVGGQPFQVAHPQTPPMYAGRSNWFMRMEPIVFNGRRYPPYGPPRVLSRSLLTRVGDYMGTPLFVERGGDPRTDVAVALYVPIRAGCIFQTYMPVEG
jgi:hypothetical protein